MEYRIREVVDNAIGKHYYPEFKRDGMLVWRSGIRVSSPETAEMVILAWMTYEDTIEANFVSEKIIPYKKKTHK